MILHIPQHLEKVRDKHITKQELIDFETSIKQEYEDGNIPAPIHLSKENEEHLI